MSSQKVGPSLRVRINAIDHTLAQPGDLDNASLPRVPVIRIYGDSSLGQKTCLHVHQVYPYFFVEYRGKLDPESVHRYIAKFSLSLNHAIAVSMKRNPHSPNSQLVRAMVLVKGVHFYGFHDAYSPFLKVHISDPAVVSRAVTILQSGTVMQTTFHVFESHLSYVLQFLCDFGLYGCGWIELDEVWQRGQDVISHDEGMGTSFPQSSSFRQSRTPLEFDVAAPQILNRHSLAARNVHHELQIPTAPLPPEPLVISVRELWEDERQRRIAKGLPASPSIPLDPSESSRDKGAGWIAEARWWEEIRNRIERERDKEAKPRDATWARWVMTTFESIEALWEPRYRTWRPKKDNGTTTTSINNTDQEDEDVVNPFEAVVHSQTNSSDDSSEFDVDVDEEKLSSQEMRSLVDRETTEWTHHQDDEETSGEEIYDSDDGEEPDEGFVDVPSDNDILDGGGTTTTPMKLPKTPTKYRRRDGFKTAWRKLTGLTDPNVDTPRPPDIFTTPTRPRISREASSPDIRLQPLGNLCATEGLGSFDEHSSAHITIRNGGSPQISDDVLPLGQFDPESYHEETVVLESIDHGSRQQFAADWPDYSGWEEVLDEQENPFLGDDRNIERPVKRRKVHHDEKLAATSSEPGTSSSTTTAHYISATQVRRSDGTLSQPAVFTAKAQAFAYKRPSPLASYLFSTLEDYGVPSKIYKNPFYSNEDDAPERAREYAGLLYYLKRGDSLANLEEWNTGSSLDYPIAPKWDAAKFDRTGVGGWEYASCPPSRREIQKWLENVSAPSAPALKQDVCLVKGKLQSNLKPHQDGAESHKARRRQSQDITIFSFELLALSRGDLVSDPDVDEIVAAFYSFRESSDTSQSRSGIIAVQRAQVDPKRLRAITIDIVSSELDLLNGVIDQVLDIDPDILVGWETQASSWGYLSARGWTYGLDVAELISRAPAKRTGGSSHQWNLRTTSTFAVVGRHVLNLWRIMRSEYNLTIYTFENVAFNVLQKRIPYYTPRVLTTWFESNISYHTLQALRHLSNRTLTNLEILDRADFVTKTAEFARIFGVDFFSVISRGSQFKVESFMFRIAKPESFVLLSPSKQDVGKQNAAECMPLIMEPLSAFYPSPLVVLDFQSLYPSIMIAYNYCYSTCLGRVVDFKGRNKFGVSEIDIRPGLLDSLKDHINVAPNGMMYVKPEVRRGLLGRMLTELLETRVMVKQAMKGAKDDEMLRRVLDARQLGLKYIANVTYGYTSATYSGRMPAVEIADSIVQSGRETLEKAIRAIDSTSRWGAKVVYGDTDSLFIYLKGKTKDQAFRIGYDIAETITRMNPAPVKLKFEKIYLPCILMAKKRYVGYKYENPDDVEASFDAKGIETVRRDGILAQRRMTEDCLRILFKTQDLSRIKEYCYRYWSDILDNKVSIQDFIFAKEVKMGTYSDRVPPPPGVTVAARRMMEDEANEPQYGERIRYVIVKGRPYSRLVDRAVAPEELLDQRQKRLDAVYYIKHVLIPPLERIFNLVGVDIRAWYDEMPKTIKVDPLDPVMLSPKKKGTFDFERLKIEEHFQPTECLSCGASASTGLCDDCIVDPQPTIASLLSQIRSTETRLKHAHEICLSCSMSTQGEPVLCDSLDCPWLFERKTAEENAANVAALEDLIEEIEELHLTSAEGDLAEVQSFV